MPVDAKKTASLVNSGLVFACASCEHYQVADDRGMKSCGLVDCGGPLTTGLTFPKYKGPVTNWKNVCWVCGQPAKVGLHFVSTNRTLGACDEHKSICDDAIGAVLLVL